MTHDTKKFKLKLKQPEESKYLHKLWFFILYSLSSDVFSTRSLLIQVEIKILIIIIKSFFALIFFQV